MTTGSHKKNNNDVCKSRTNNNDEVKSTLMPCLKVRITIIGNNCNNYPTCNNTGTCKNKKTIHNIAAGR